MNRKINSLLTCLATLSIASADSLYEIDASVKETLPLKWTVGTNVIYDATIVPTAENRVGDFSVYVPKQTAIPQNLASSFSSFPLAMNNNEINEEIDWKSYSYGVIDNINVIGGGFVLTGNGLDFIPVIGHWPNPPRKPEANIIRIPEIPWISGKDQAIEVPIETDGEIFSAPEVSGSSIRQQIIQEWVTDVTKIQLDGEDYDVYANVTPSNDSFSYISVDAERRVYISYPNFSNNQTSGYYRIDTQGLGQYIQTANMPSIVTHRIPANVTETTQRLVSTKLLLTVSANPQQKIRTHQVRLYKERRSAYRGENATKSLIYQMGDVAPHDVAVDQIGDVLPTEGTIVPWHPSMAGSYTGTLTTGYGDLCAPIGDGVLRSLTISKNGLYSGVMQIRGQAPLHIRGRFFSRNSTSVSVEFQRGKVTKRGCRLAFMRMADGKVSLIARCYFRDFNDYFCLAEKIGLPNPALPARHTLIVPIADQNGGTSNATGQMLATKSANAQILWRFANGRTFATTTRITEKGMIPIFLEGGNHSVVGRLRYNPTSHLGSWTGGITYRAPTRQNDYYNFSGICVGHPYNGWSTQQSAATVHIEYTNNQIVEIPANFSQNQVIGAGITLNLSPNGTITGTLESATGQPMKLFGIALASQDIWTCSSNSTDIKKITVTGIISE